MASTRNAGRIGPQADAGSGMDRTSLPWNFSDTVFQCAWEYPVADFDAEVGFFVDKLGFSALALDDDYALFTVPGNNLTLACRRHDHASSDYSGHILCFMTKDIEVFADALEARIGANAVTRVAGSSVQTVLRITSPAGVQIDIWEFPT